MSRTPHTDPLEQSFDRLTRATDVPDAAYWTRDGTFEEAVRRRDAARAQDEEARGYSPSHPAGRGWVPQSRDLGIPGEHLAFPTFSHDGTEYVFARGMPQDVIAHLGCGEVFTRERRVRFLDHLAFQGNARAAARAVNVSHETAYRARRQDAAFAALWDAALVHARSYGEQVLATRALDGVEVPIVQRGEITGYVTKHDTRLLLAHLARLDRRVEADAAATARAGRFDELLAQYAGHEAPAGFAEAAAEARDPREPSAAPDLPPTREAYVGWSRGQAMGGRSEKSEAHRMQAAGEAAGEEWDDWHQGALEKVGSIVEPVPEEREGEGDDNPNSVRVERSRDTADGLSIDDRMSAVHPEPAGSEAEAKPQRLEANGVWEGDQGPPLPLAGGAGGGPVAPTSDTPTPNPSRKREGEGTVPTDLPYEVKSAPAPARKPAEFRRFEPCHRRQPPLAGGPDGAAFPRTSATPRRIAGNPGPAARWRRCEAASAPTLPPSPPSMTGAASSSERREP